MSEEVDMEGAHPGRVAQVKMVPQRRLAELSQSAAEVGDVPTQTTKVGPAVQGVEQVSGFREAALQRLAVP